MNHKLHLGCGACYLPPHDGWVNVDIFDNIKSDAISSVTDLPFHKESFDLIYASHILEHIHRNRIISTLSHWVRLLKPGGTLRIAVPNFRAVAEHYMQHGDLKVLIGLLYGGQNMPLNVHTMAFDDKTLSESMVAAGLRDIRWWDWKKTEHTQFDDYSQCFLPHLDKENGKLMSLNLEGKKPE